MSLCLKVIYGTFANKSGFVIYITPGPAQRSSKSKDDNPLILLGRKLKRRTRVPHLVLQIRSKTPTLVVFRVKKRETGKVNITTKKESSSRTRDRPVVNNLTWVSYLKINMNIIPASAGSGSGGLFAIIKVLWDHHRRLSHKAQTFRLLVCRLRHFS